MNVNKVWSYNVPQIVIPSRESRHSHRKIAQTYPLPDVHWIQMVLFNFSVIKYLSCALDTDGASKNLWLNSIVVVLYACMQRAVQNNFDLLYRDGVQMCFDRSMDQYCHPLPNLVMGTSYQLCLATAISTVNARVDNTFQFQTNDDTLLECLISLSPIADTRFEGFVQANVLWSANKFDNLDFSTCSMRSFVRFDW